MSTLFKKKKERRSLAKITAEPCMESHTEPTFAFGEIEGGGNPFARSATSLGASPHHLPKATSFAPLAQHHLRQRRGLVHLCRSAASDALASLDMMTHCVRPMLCPADTNEKTRSEERVFLVSRLGVNRTFKFFWEAQKGVPYGFVKRFSRFQIKGRLSSTRRKGLSVMSVPGRACCNSARQQTAPKRQ